MNWEFNLDLGSLKLWTLDLIRALKLWTQESNWTQKLGTLLSSSIAQSLQLETVDLKWILWLGSQ